MPDIRVESKNIYFTPEQMSNIAFGGGDTKSDNTGKIIAVFPLMLNSEESNIYAVVNYTDTTTLLTTKFVNYPDNIIAFFDKMAIDSTERTIADMPIILESVLREVDNNIEEFSENHELVNTPLGYSTTKVVDDDDFRPPAGCRVEVETTGTYSKVNERYGPLMQTEWSQGSPFNSNIPSNYKVGCVAVALGQILKYHKYPVSLPYCGIVPYGNMPNKYVNNNYEISQYIGPFLRYVADEVHMDYGDNSSGATMHNARVFLERFYSVSKDNAGKRFDSGHIEKCRQSMKSSNPVLISADRTISKGHTWVIEGYEHSARVEYQVYRYYDQNNNLIYTQHLENPVAAFEFFYHNIGWGSSSPPNYIYNVWLNVHANLTFVDYTYDRNIDLFYVSK